MNSNNSSKKNIVFKMPAIAWMVLPLLIFFIFGFHHLTKFETADEHYWLYSNTAQGNYWQMNNGRIQQYWSAIAHGDLDKTRINDKPGITLAYVSGIGSFLKTRLEHSLASGVHQPMDKISKAELVNAYFRFPQLIFLGFFLLLVFFLTKRLTGNKWIAIFSTVFIMLSPALIGVAQIINPDSLLWAFGFAAILSYLIHLKERSRKYAVLAGLFLGLCLLTKYTSVILIPFFLIAALSFILENEHEKDEDFSKNVFFYMASFLGVVAIGLLIFAFVLPDNLINPEHFLKGSIGLKGSAGIFVAIFASAGLLILDAKFFRAAVLKKTFKVLKTMQAFSKYAILAVATLIFLLVVLDPIILKDKLGIFLVPFDASVRQYFAFGINWRVLLSQFSPLIFSLSPLVLLLVILAWPLAMAKKFDKQTNWLIFILSLFVLVFVLAASLQKVPLSMRYSIMLYPVVFFLAAFSLVRILEIISQKEFFKYGAYVFVLFVGIVSLWLVKPYYFNYTNALLPSKYIIADAWGYGGYEIAEYLNQTAKGEMPRIWSDYNGVCLFYNGACAANKLTMENILKDQKKAGKPLPNFGYFVSSRRGQALSHSLWEDLDEKYQSENIYTVKIGKRLENSMNVYKVD